MITVGRQRLEPEAQDFLNTHFTELENTLLVHGEETMMEQLKVGSWFFTQVLNEAERCYSKNGMWQESLPEVNKAAIEAAAKECFCCRLEMAHGFYKGAEVLLLENYCASAMFLLHQCVEQACSALIRVFLNYRSDIHNLGRLMKLSLCFTDMPHEVFPQESTEDRRLFSLLQKSYSEARYQAGFEVEKADCLLLQQRVKNFMDRMETMCGEKLVKGMIF